MHYVAKRRAHGKFCTSVLHATCKIVLALGAYRILHRDGFWAPPEVVSRQ
jgi:hypothetical protein